MAKSPPMPHSGELFSLPELPFVRSSSRPAKSALDASCRTAWISDVHLGTRASNVGAGKCRSMRKSSLLASAPTPFYNRLSAFIDQHWRNDPNANVAAIAGFTQLSLRRHIPVTIAT